MSGKKEKFIPLNPPRVTMYACGITPYDHSHIGHAMQAMAFQMIKNYLEFSGYSVHYVRNYTDVDDKILDRAQESGISAAALTEKMIAQSQQDFAALNVAPADDQPRVSECIPHIIAFIQTLITNNNAYATPSGHVYYRVRNKEDYGKLSHRKLDDMLQQSRDIVSEDKEYPLDFALWKADPSASFSWQSPWGKGRPGWHIECSAMIHATLGHPIDIHGGGRDLLFPHHENEIAQSESCYGAPFVRYWIHSGLLTISGQKMSKSLGNHITIQDFLARYPAEVLRLCCLEHHYRGDIDFSEQMFVQGTKKLYSYYELIDRAHKHVAMIPPNAHPSPAEMTALFSSPALQQRFKDTMDDDFNTVKVMAWLHSLFKHLRKITSQKPQPWHRSSIENLLNFLQDLHRVLGILGNDPEQYLRSHKAAFLESHNIQAATVEGWIAKRQEARQTRDWQTADHLRHQLTAMGIELADNPDGTTSWHVKTALSSLDE